MAGAKKEKDPLVEELTRVSNRRFHMLDERRGSYKPVADIDTLTRLAAEFTQDEEELNRGERIEKLIRAATDMIDDADRKRRIKLLFGLFPDMGYMTARGLHANLREVLNEKKDKKTSYEANQKVLCVLASAIHARIIEHRKKNPQAWRQYIRRSKYHELFGEALDSGYRIIELVGLPGMGKSWLAEGLTRERLAGCKAPRIRFVNDSLFIPDLQAALLRYGIHVEIEDVVENPELYLAKLLCGERVPEFIILDNLTNAEVIYDSLLPDETKSTVVVTSRVRSGQSDEKRVALFVDRMTKKEAADLIKKLVPGISEGDCQVLVEALHDYPLLIGYACTLLMRQPFPVKEFCAAINRDIVSLAGKAKTDAGKSLTVVLQHLLELLRRESELAYEILECLSFIDGHPSIRLIL